MGVVSAHIQMERHKPGIVGQLYHAQWTVRDTTQIQLVQLHVVKLRVPLLKIGSQLHNK